MTYDITGHILVLLQELSCTGKCYLIDEFVHFFGCHTDSAVGNGQCILLLVSGYPHGQITELTFQLAGIGQCLHLLSSIHCIGHYLPEEDLMVRIEKLLDNGENIFSCYPYFSFLLCHIVNFKYFLFCWYGKRHTTSPTLPKWHRASMTGFCMILEFSVFL